MILKAESRNACGDPQGSVLEGSSIYKQGCVLEAILLYFHDLTSGHQPVVQPLCNLPMQINHVALPGILTYFYKKGLHQRLKCYFFQACSTDHSRCYRIALIFSLPFVKHIPSPTMQ